jgi:hypothetical protein
MSDSYIELFDKAGTNATKKNFLHGTSNCLVPEDLEKSYVQRGMQANTYKYVTLQLKFMADIFKFCNTEQNPISR